MSLKIINVMEHPLVSSYLRVGENHSYILFPDRLTLNIILLCWPLLSIFKYRVSGNDDIERRFRADQEQPFPLPTLLM